MIEAGAGKSDSACKGRDPIRLQRCRDQADPWNDYAGAIIVVVAHDRVPKPFDAKDHERPDLKVVPSLTAADKCSAGIGIEGRTGEVVGDIEICLATSQVVADVEARPGEGRQGA